MSSQAIIPAVVPAESATTFPRTKTSSHANSPALRSSFQPVKRLAAEHQMKVLCLAVAIVSPLISLYFVSQAVRDARAPQTAFAIDGAGVIHIGPLESLNPRAEIFREICLLFSQTFFNRGPAGLDSPELAKRIMTEAVFTQLNEWIESDAKLFTKRNYYQQVQIEAIDLLDDTYQFRANPRYRIRGWLKRDGIIDGIEVREPPQYFRMSILLVPNPNMVDRSRYPFMVSDYRLFWTNSKYEEMPDTQQVKSDLEDVP